MPSIDFSNDPLLQGRLFSYLDTQLSRVVSPNFHQIPVNKPKCPFANFQRDGHMQIGSQKGSVANESNTLDEGLLPEDPARGFQSRWLVQRFFRLPTKGIRRQRTMFLQIGPSRPAPASPKQF